MPLSMLPHDTPCYHPSRLAVPSGLFSSDFAFTRIYSYLTHADVYYQMDTHDQHTRLTGLKNSCTIPIAHPIMFNVEWHRRDLAIVFEDGSGGLIVCHRLQFCCKRPLIGVPEGGVDSPMGDVGAAFFVSGLLVTDNRGTVWQTKKSSFGFSQSTGRNCTS
jgi:hypothetical protein